MGATMQWRQPPDRENHLHGDLVEFGRGRSRGRGYLAHADRAGPGVLLLEPGGHRRADSLSADGFTVLVPEGDLGEERHGAVAAAAEYLSANWHPRLGVVAYGLAAASAARSLVERGIGFDVLVLYGALWPEEPFPATAVLGHFSEEASAEVDLLRAGVVDAGGEPDLYLYAADPAPGGLSPHALELADERTLETLEYLLS